MEKVLNYDFYEVELPDNAVPFETILENVNHLQGEHRTYDNGQYHVRLDNLVQRPGYYLGDIARIRMSDIPDRMRLSGERTPIDLRVDEGLGEIASFIYNPTLRALIYMRNRNSVTASGFANYFQSRGHVPGIVFLHHVLDESAYQRLARMTVAHRLDIGIAAPGNAAIFDNLGLRARTIADLMNAAPKVRMDFSISMERSQRGLTLPLRQVRNLVRDLTTDYGEEIINLTVSGKENPEQRLDFVDMLEEVMTEKQPVTLARNQRAITDRQRHDAIVTAYTRKLGELTRILRNDEAAN